VRLLNMIFSPAKNLLWQISLQTENNEVSLSVIFHAAKKLGALQAHRFELMATPYSKRGPKNDSVI
jgi:nucleoid-associated protein YgaU